MTDLRLLDLKKRLRVRGGLPVFSASLERVLALVHRRDLSMRRIAEAVEEDPSLAGRILKLANSAYYGLSHRVASLNLALVLLGVRTLRNLVHGIGFMEVLDESESTGPYPGADFRNHSVECARAAVLLAKLHGLPQNGEHFIAGLVHDIGKLVLLRAFPECVTAHAAELRATGAVLSQGEERVFGLNHAEAGAWAAQAWHLPSSLVEAIRRHHDEPQPNSAESAPPELPQIVRAANQVVHWHAERDESDALPRSWRDDPVLSHRDLTPIRIHESVAVAVEILE